MTVSHHPPRADVCRNRHFPSRDALVVAAYQHEVDPKCTAAAELLPAQPSDGALRYGAPNRERQRT